VGWRTIGSRERTHCGLRGGEKARTILEKGAEVLVTEGKKMS